MGAALGALVRNQVVAVTGTLVVIFVVHPLIADDRPDGPRVTPFGAAQGVAGAGPARRRSIRRGGGVVLVGWTLAALARRGRDGDGGATSHDRAAAPHDRSTGASWALDAPLAMGVSARWSHRRRRCRERCGDRGRGAVRRRACSRAAGAPAADAGRHSSPLRRGVRGHDPFPGGIAPLVALYTVASSCERRVSLAALVLTVSSVSRVVVPSGDQLSTPSSRRRRRRGGSVVYVETRRKYPHALERARGLLEREREQLARLAAHEERAAIARELHDIVAHSVTVMLIGVRGARDVLRSRPDVADATLGKVETSGEQSLVELRRILGCCASRRTRQSRVRSRRSPQLDGSVGGVPKRGAPGDARADRATSGRSPAASSSRSIASSRKRSPTCSSTRAPSSVVVTLAFRDSALELEVVDDGAPLRRDAVVPGHGLVGMRERVALLGGELETRAGGESGGFRVAARLPVGGDA